MGAASSTRALHAHHLHRTAGGRRYLPLAGQALQMELDGGPDLDQHGLTAGGSGHTTRPVQSPRRKSWPSKVHSRLLFNAAQGAGRQFITELSRHRNPAGPDRVLELPVTAPGAARLLHPNKPFSRHLPTRLHPRQPPHDLQPHPQGATGDHGCAPVPAHGEALCGCDLNAKCM